MAKKRGILRGLVPLGERVGRNEVRPQGETSPSLLPKMSEFVNFIKIGVTIYAD